MNPTVTQMMIEGILSRSKIVKELKEQIDLNTHDSKILQSTIEDLMSSIVSLKAIVEKQEHVIESLILALNGDVQMDGLLYDVPEINKDKLN